MLVGVILMDFIIYFIFLGEHVTYLREKYHIYLTSDGRMNMCGLNVNNMDYVARAFHEAITGESFQNCINDS